MIVTKAVHMAQMMSIPVLGLIENYSYYQCPDCGAKHAIFGESHLEQEAMQLGLPLLAQLPIDPELAAAIDMGKAETLPVNYLEGRGGAAGRVRGASNVRRGGTAQTEHRAQEAAARPRPFVPLCALGGA